MPTVERFLRFSAVGALGLGVKFGALILLKSVMGFDYMWATGIAVELAILHNFTWHLRWTWKDRCDELKWRDILMRLLRLHMTSGAMAMITNLAVMRLAVGVAGLNYIVANVLATIIASSMNFAMANWLVFIPQEERLADAARETAGRP